MDEVQCLSQSCGSGLNESGSGYESGSNPGPRVEFWWPKEENNTAGKDFFFFFVDQKLQFTCVQATGETFSPQKRTTSTSKMKIFNFFLCLWVIFALLDPDPDTDPGTPFYPDPQHWVVLFYTKRLSRKHRKNSFGLACVVDRIMSRFLHQCGSGSGELNQCGSIGSGSVAKSWN